jgi:hypothetical protein
MAKACCRCEPTHAVRGLRAQQIRFAVRGPCAQHKACALPCATHTRHAGAAARATDLHVQLRKPCMLTWLDHGRRLGVVLEAVQPAGHLLNLRRHRPAGLAVLLQQRLARPRLGVCTHTCMHTHTHTRTHASTHARTHPRMHACTHARTQTRTHPHTHARTHPRMRACKHARTHARSGVGSSRHSAGV